MHTSINPVDSTGGSEKASDWFRLYEIKVVNTEPENRVHYFPASLSIHCPLLPFPRAELSYNCSVRPATTDSAGIAVSPLIFHIFSLLKMPSGAILTTIMIHFQKNRL